MKRIHNTKFALGLLVFSAAMLNGCSKAEASKLLIDQTDLGLLRAGTKVESDFRFRNDSDEDWVVKSVQRSCNCANADLEKRTRPGEELAVVVALVRNDPGAFGVTLSVNMENGTTLRATITGEVFTPVHFVPAALTFEGDRPDILEVRAPAHLNPPELALDAELFESNVEFTKWKLVEDYWIRRVTVKPSKSLANRDSGLFRLVVRRGKESTRLPVAYEYLSPSRWEPTPRMALLSDDAIRELNLFVDGRSGAPKIVSVTADDSAVPVPFRQNGRRLTVSLHELEQMPDELVLSDRHGEKKTVVVSVME